MFHRTLVTVVICALAGAGEGCARNTRRIQVALAECESGRPLVGTYVRVEELVRLLPGPPVASAKTDDKGLVVLRVPADDPGKSWQCWFTWRGGNYEFGLSGRSAEVGTVQRISADRNYNALPCVQASLSDAP